MLKVQLCKYWSEWLSCCKQAWTESEVPSMKGTYMNGERVRVWLRWWVDLRSVLWWCVWRTFGFYRRKSIWSRNAQWSFFLSRREGTKLRRLCRFCQELGNRLCWSKVHRRIRALLGIYWYSHHTCYRCQGRSREWLSFCLHSYHSNTTFHCPNAGHKH